MDPDDAHLVAAEDGAEAEARIAARPPGSVRHLAIGMSAEDAFSFEHVQFYRWMEPGPPLALARILAAVPDLTRAAIQAREIDTAGARHDSLFALTLMSAAWPRLAGALFPRLDKLELSVEAPGDPAGEAAAILAGDFAPALTELRLGGDGIAPIVLALPRAPLVGRLERLIVSADIDIATACRLVEEPGFLLDLEALSFHDAGGEYLAGGAAPWLSSLERARGAGGVAHLEAARALTRCRAWFFAPIPPDARVWEWTAGSEAAGVGSLVTMPRTAGGPTSAEEACFPLAGIWRRIATQGWIDSRRAPGAEVPLADRHWDGLLTLLAGDNPLDPSVRGNAFRPLEPGAFERELALIRDAMRMGPRLQVLENHARAIPDPERFEPPIGRVSRAVAARDAWNDKLYIAETAEAFLLWIWWTTA